MQWIKWATLEFAVLFPSHIYDSDCQLYICQISQIKLLQKINWDKFFDLQTRSL